ncbi:MAG: BCD family MFS transporter [Pseudomonadota bacterium]
MNGTAAGLGWLGIVRLGLIQTSLGAVVVLMTSTINRVMIVELGLAAVLPGILIGIHYVVQLARPRFGHGSDSGGQRTPWIIAGMAVLCVGGVMAAASLYLFEYSWLAGVVAAIVAFVLVGAGVGASGTLLLVLLASTVRPERRAAAATTTWLMMIAGFIVTTIASSKYLDPFSLDRLLAVTTTVAAIALIVTVLAVIGIERRFVRPDARSVAVEPTPTAVDFRTALHEVLTEKRTRTFAAFVFLSMLAYSGLDVLLEPFAGAVHGMTPAESTQLTGFYSAGLLAGMLLVALIGSIRSAAQHRAMRWCMLFGCLGSAVGLGVLATSALSGQQDHFVGLVITIGLTNGLFAVAAIGSMMGLMSQGHRGRDGVRMGLWGAAQALAFGSGAVLGGAIIDTLHWLGIAVAGSYAAAFIVLGMLYAMASAVVTRIDTNVAGDGDKARINPLHAAAALDLK